MFPVLLGALVLFVIHVLQTVLNMLERILLWTASWSLDGVWAACTLGPDRDRRRQVVPGGCGSATHVHGPQVATQAYRMVGRLPMSLSAHQGGTVVSKRIGSTTGARIMKEVGFLLRNDGLPETFQGAS